MKMLPNETNMQTFCDVLEGRKNIPKGFSGMQGGAPRDALNDNSSIKTELLAEYTELFESLFYLP